jgi:N-methylhydantoinase B
MTTVERTAKSTLLRDLTGEHFVARYDGDRFTASVLANRLRYSAQHVTPGLLYRSARPPS